MKMVKRMTQKKLKIRYDRIIILVAIIIAIFVGIFGITRDMKLKNTNEYKLEKIGYTKEEVKIILDSTKEKELETILKREYHASIPKLLKEQYFQFEKLERYLSYIDNKEKIKEKVTTKQAVSIVGANADYEFYTNTEKTDTSKDLLLLVNKHYELDKEYKPDDLVPCSPIYAYDNNSLREEAYSAFKRLFNDAKKEGLTIVINSSYRDYEWQDNLYQGYKRTNGKKYADEYAAHAGFSEHQTGLAIDVSSFSKPMASFEETEEFTWMSKNAHKYGFILRYPKGEENEAITGYKYESWHYRYVGIDTATEIYEKGITFDEYYDYYLK